MSFPTTVTMYFINQTDYDVHWRNKKDDVKYRRACPDSYPRNYQGPEEFKSKSYLQTYDDLECVGRNRGEPNCKMNNYRATDAKCSQCKAAGCYVDIYDAKKVRWSRCQCRDANSFGAGSCPGGTSESWGINRCPDCYKWIVRTRELSCADVGGVSCPANSGEYCEDKRIDGFCERRTCNSNEKRYLGNCYSPCRADYNVDPNNKLNCWQTGACKANMAVNGYCDGGSWALPTNYYRIGYDECTNCGGRCVNATYQVATFNPAMFDSIGGYATSASDVPNKMVSGAVILEQGHDTAYYGLPNKTYSCVVNLQKVDSLSKKDEIKNFFAALVSATNNPVLTMYNDAAITIMTYYIYMNVAIPNFAPSTYMTDVALFIGANANSGSTVYRKDGSDISKILTVDTTATSSPGVSSFKRNYGSEYYDEKSDIRRQKCAAFGLACETRNYGVSYTVKKINPSFLTIDNLNVISYVLQQSPRVDSPSIMVEPFQPFLGKQIEMGDQSVGATTAFASPFTVNQTAVFLVRYNVNDLVSNIRPVERLNEFKVKFIDCTDLDEKYKVWNRYVYANWLLPIFCFNSESDNNNCPSTLDYNTNTMVNNACSRLASVADCKKYLWTNVNDAQPAQNKIRTESFVGTAWENFCKNGTNKIYPECQCLTRDLQDAYTRYGFDQSNTGFDSNVAGNAGCWYRPCIGDNNQDNIFIPYAFRPGRKNCPASVCSSIITVANRPANKATFSNISLVANCPGLPTPSPSPALFPATTRSSSPSLSLSSSSSPSLSLSSSSSPRSTTSGQPMNISNVYPSAPNTSSIMASSTSTSPQTSTKSKLFSTQNIILITCGIGVILLIIGVAIFIVRKRRQQNKQGQAGQGTQTPQGTQGQAAREPQGTQTPQGTQGQAARVPQGTKAPQGTQGTKTQGQAARVPQGTQGTKTQGQAARVPQGQAARGRQGTKTQGTQGQGARGTQQKGV